MVTMHVVDGHPDAETFSAFADLTLREVDRYPFVDHVFDCQRCREQYTTTLALNPKEPSLPQQFLSGMGFD